MTGLATAPIGKVCLSCGKWDAGVCCDETLQSEFEGEDTAPDQTCPYWEEIEIQKWCQTCRHWLMARRQRFCLNKEAPEYGLLMKARECCRDSWAEAPSVDYVVHRR